MSASCSKQLGYMKFIPKDLGVFKSKPIQIKTAKPIKKNLKTAKKTNIIECIWMSFYKNRLIQIRFQIDFSKPIQTEPRIFIFILIFNIICCYNLLFYDTYFLKTIY